MPKISIILPVYNSEKYVAASIESILNQTYHDYEFIIIDDGSTDSSLHVVKSFMDPRIRLIKKSNSGLADTLNYGIKLSTGELIARMDNDDVALPNRLLFQVHSFRKTTAVLGGQADILDSNCNLCKGPRFPTEHVDILKRLSRGKSSIIHPSVLISKAMLLKVGCYDDRSSAEDADLWFRLCKVGRLENLKSVVLYLRKHDQSMTILMREKHIIDHITAIMYYKKYGRYSKISEEEFKEFNEMAKNMLEEESYILKSKVFARHKHDFINGDAFHKMKYLLRNPSFFGLYITILKTRRRIFAGNA
jgi:glycosyltransferase involved in cell wall biosynthesis